MPLMYLESMVDGAMKGVGEQKAAFRYSVWDSCLRIVGVLLLLPRFGMTGFLGGDLAVQLLHLRSQHRAAAAFQRHRARLPALAGCTALCWLLPPPGRQGGAAASLAGFPAQRRVTGAAGSADGGRHGDGLFLRRRCRWGFGRKLRAVAAGRQRPGKTESDKNVNFLDTGGDCEYNTNVLWGILPALPGNTAEKAALGKSRRLRGKKEDRK